MKVLFLSRWYPYPIDNGSKLRIDSLLHGLAQHHDVTLISFADGPGTNLEAPELRLLRSQVQVIPWTPYNPTSRRARLGLLSTVPRSIVATHSPEMARAIRSAMDSTRFDLVIASQWQMASYAPHFAGTRAVFEEVELGVFYEQLTQARSLPSRLRHGLTWTKQQQYLLHLLKSFQACTVVSEREKALLAHAAPKYRAVEIVPNCIDVADYAAGRVEKDPNQLIFAGSFRYHANYDAMCWFVQDILPRIAAEAPGVKLAITGDHAGRLLPPAANVTLTGFVDDVRPLVASASVSIVPLRIGGGTRLKILESMALRTPVVTTSKGAEGLAVRHDEHLLIADSPAGFAEAVLRLTRDQALGQRLADNAYRLVAEEYDWSAIMPQFHALIQRVASG